MRRRCINATCFSFILCLLICISGVTLYCINPGSLYFPQPLLLGLVMCEAWIVTRVASSVANIGWPLLSENIPPLLKILLRTPRTPAKCILLEGVLLQPDIPRIVNRHEANRQARAMRLIFRRDQIMEVCGQNEAWVERDGDWIFSHTKIILKKDDQYFVATSMHRYRSAADVNLADLDPISIPASKIWPQYPEHFKRAPTPIPENCYVKRPSLLYYGDTEASTVTSNQSETTLP